MGKLNKIFNSRKKIKKGKAILNKNGSFCIDGYTFTDMKEFIDDVGLEDKEIEHELYVMLGVAALTIGMLIQLRYSCTESPQYFDGLPSTKYYKKKIITATPGVAWCTIIPAFESFEFLGLDLIDILETFIGDPILPTKKITKLTKDNCSEFFKSRRSSLLGSLNSCPATQATFFNLNSDCVNWSVDDFINFIFPNGLPTNITKENLTESLMNFILTTGNHNKLETVSFDEANNINSKIESEIFGDKIVRNNIVDTRIKSSGNLPDNRLTEGLLQQVFTSSELRRYKVALRFGDKSSIKEFNDLAKTRLSEKSDKPANAAEAAEAPSESKGKAKRLMGKPKHD